MPAELPSTPRDELQRRIGALQRRLADDGVDAALVAQNVDLLYFTGSMQSGVLVVPAGGRPVYAVRRALERARRESALEPILPLARFRDLAGLVRGLVRGPVRGVGKRAGAGNTC